MSACVVEPLERLADEVRAFVQRPELRTLHVAADGHLYAGALAVLLAAEHLADNHEPWIVADVDTHRDDAWVHTETQLVREHDTRRRAGAPLAPLVTDVAGSAGPARCAARIHQLAVSVQKPAQGLVVLLACGGASVSETWLTRLGDMLLDPVLGSVRVVVLTPLCPAALVWFGRLPRSGCVVHRCEVDPAAVTAELAAEIEAEENGGGTWPVGAVPPKREPPKRELAADGSSAPRMVVAAPAPRPLTIDDEIHTCVKRALLALRRADGPECARQQARARDLCRENGRREDAVRMELVLGGYLVQLREQEQAQASFARAAAAAGELGAHVLQAQSCYAEAHVWQERRRFEEAIRCYWAGIEAAKRGKHVQLLFDGYWEAGQVLRPLDRSSALVSLWADALHAAGDFPPTALRRTRLEDVARGLSAELRTLRRSADARAVDEWLTQILAQQGGAAGPAASAKPTAGG